MLGSYRLGLALLVALSHIGTSIAGHNPGVVAVVGFYLVSGYVMTGLLRSHYTRLDRIPAFYADRLLRLYPAYLSIACMTYAWFLLTGVRTEYLRTSPRLGNIVENVTVVPLNFYMFNHADQFTLIPPAWSLGAEMQFYLIIPLLLFIRAGMRVWALSVSIAIFLAAAFGFVNSDWYGYRLLPGVLFMFLLGSWLYDMHQAREPSVRAPIVLMVIALVANVGVALHLAGKLLVPYNLEILGGLVLGIVTLNVLGHRSRNKVDDALGNLSYGVFLNHFLIMWAFFDGRVEGFISTASYLGISVLIAFVMYSVVERPVLTFRRDLRKSPGTQRVLLDLERR